jgi:SAM-dependent methyltransferase
MKHTILKLGIKILGHEYSLKFAKMLSHLSRKIAYKVHRFQFTIEWGKSPNPEWFDHYLDQYYLFRQTQNPLWVERGVFNLLAIHQHAEILELCCGDGFNSFHFYSVRAKHIIAVDFDIKAIQHATHYNQASNIQYSLCDIRYQMPEGKFDNILWDAAIGHFTSTETETIMRQIKSRLKDNGILSGYTIIERLDGVKSLQQHEYEFKSKEELRDFFQPYFNNVRVFETDYTSRRNLYFFASDTTLPFDSNWKLQTIMHKTC